MMCVFGDYLIKEYLSVEFDIWDNILIDDDDFFVVVSDGLWNVMSNDEVVEYVLVQMIVEGVVKVLVVVVFRRGSRDDILVFVVCFKDLSFLS